MVPTTLTLTCANAEAADSDTDECDNATDNESPWISFVAILVAADTLEVGGRAHVLTTGRVVVAVVVVLIG